MKNELVEYLERKVESSNNFVREKYGIKYFFDEDTCFDDWLECIPEVLWEKHNLEEPDDILETSDVGAITDLTLHLKEWCSKYFSSKTIKVCIDERRKEDARDARTQAMEMGFHDYSNGSYYPSEGGYSYY
tara:strand:- start:85 stop:477 length:393 start_codon:yes stop_codon:yes gene_type:complete